jgi:hypothetical protein
MHHYEDSPYHGQSGSSFVDPYIRPTQRLELSQSFLTSLGAAVCPLGMGTPQLRSTMSRSLTRTSVSDPYSGILNNRQHRHPRNLDPTMSSEFVPNSIEDGGDGGLDDRREYRSSMLSLGHNSDGNANAVAKDAATGGVILDIWWFCGKESKWWPNGTTIRRRSEYGLPRSEWL